MNEEQKRVVNFYENIYGKGSLKPEDELRERREELEASIDALASALEGSDDIR